MLERLSQRHKLLLLLGGIPAALILLYVITCRPTVEMVGLHSKLQTEKTYLDETLQLNAPMGDARAPFISTNHTLKEELLAHVSNYHENDEVNILAFYEGHKSQQGDYVIGTESFVMQGRYGGLLRFISYLESKLNNAYLVSFQFETFSDRKDKNEKLKVKIYVQALS